MVDGQHEVVFGVKFHSEIGAEPQTERTAAEKLAVTLAYNAFHCLRTVRAAVAAAEHRICLHVENLGKRPVENGTGKIVIEIACESEF